MAEQRGDKRIQGIHHTFGKYKTNN
ncbi:hypothetical protein CCACVL1_04024 [Corchorus capsularis]|uniref:Uncharacterized protein n=1 Tax=Corchorus capsularis TaxID=210143 RepID=A0A1R3JVJ2_COCAP|nr:hypothetical protein CCACVL1_04024 [Corchorus capsularis]